jgi:hypothetical protein
MLCVVAVCVSARDGRRERRGAYLTLKKRQARLAKDIEELKEEDVPLIGQGAGGILLSSACGVRARGRRGVEG